MKKVLSFIVGLAALVSCSKNNNLWQLQSPEGDILITMSLNDETGRLTYQVASKSSDGTLATAIEPSPLGLQFDEAELSEGLKFISASEVKTIDETYQMVAGKQKQIRMLANEMTLQFANSSGMGMAVTFRAFDDGAALRYTVSPSTGVTDTAAYTLLAELTGFDLPDSGNVWAHPYDTVVDWAPAYETFYEGPMSIGTAAPANKNGWAFPLLFETNNLWVLISESDVTKGHAAMHLQADCPKGLYTLRLPEANEAFDMCGARPVVTLPYQSAWRCIVVSRDLAGIVETEMINNCAAASKIDDTSWIHPGRASWSWWSVTSSPRDYNALKEFVDFSARMGWEYSLVDANWNEMKGGDLQKLAEYARTKNVGLLVWYNSGGANNVVTEQPRDIMNNRELRRAEFKKLQEWGIKGVKIDFFQSDKPCIINQYIETLEDAAEFHILVNFHGCTLPRGWSRTYPNLLTLESVRGGEAYIFDSKYPTQGPVHQTILPFTRNVVGPMDYTPVGLSDLKYPHLTTFAYELALAVVFESGITHFADNFKAYEALPEFALDYLKNFPAAWDETRFIDGYPGKLAIIARRSGTTWYVAGISCQQQPERISILCPFLTEDKTYQANLITSGDSRNELVNSTEEVSQSKGFEVDMSALGGFVAVIAIAK